MRIKLENIIHMAGHLAGRRCSTKISSPPASGVDMGVGVESSFQIT